MTKHQKFIHNIFQELELPLPTEDEIEESFEAWIEEKACLADKFYDDDNETDSQIKNIIDGR